MRIYRASGLGGCLKAQIAGHLEYRAIDTSKAMETFGNEGELHERDIVEKLGNVTFQQHEVRMELSPAFDVVGHIDGIVETEDGVKCVLEVKSMGKDPFKTWMNKEWDTPGLVQKYKWQVSAYMIATRLPCLFVVKSRDSGKWERYFLHEPFYTRQEIMERVIDMEVMVRRGELPDTCSVSQFPCPFFYLHDVIEQEIAEDAVIDELAQMYEQARLDVKAAETRQKEARKALDAGMGERERIETDHAKVTYYQRNGSKFDMKKAKEELGEDVIESFMTPTQYTGIRVTVKEDNEVERESDEPRGDSEGTIVDQPSVEDAAGA